MEFRTEIQASPSSWKIESNSKIMFMGSCFADNIGQKLEEQKMSTLINPFGVLYNPVSIHKALIRIARRHKAQETDLVQIRDLWASFDFHGSFSGLDKGQVLWSINSATEDASDYLAKADYLIVTLGTAWIYRLKSTGSIVANCHKVPDEHFENQRLGVPEITEALKGIVEEAIFINPGIKVIFSVSPIRHWKDGAHENQLSKAALMLSADAAVTSADKAEYFPAYEYLMDDLRDYRFYKKNLISPSGEAVEYIYQKFQQTYFSDGAIKTIAEVSKFMRAANHRPFNRLSESHQKFVREYIADLKAFAKQHAYLDLSNELNLLQGQLS
jgi:hypothetical protein